MNNAEFDISPRILYVQYTNPAGYPPLEHSSRILAEDGWKILFLGTGAFGANSFSFLTHPNITVRKIPFCSSGWRQKLHYVWFCFWVIGWMLWWQPRWIYASDLLSCPIALFLSFLPNVRVIYHEHDSPENSSKSRFLKLCLFARKRLAHRVSLCILPNQRRADNFDKTVEKLIPSICVWNCPSQEEIAPPREEKRDKEMWLFYHGSIVPPQLPQTIVKAMSMLPERIKLRIVGYETIGHVDYVQFLKDLAVQLGIVERIEYLGSVPTRTELLQHCQTCDVGLSLFPFQSRQPMAGASNKSFDYLACGLPLLVSDLPDWQQMYVEPGYGLDCNPDDANSIAAALKWFLAHPAQRREMGEKGRRKIANEWNYEQQFQPILEVLNQSI